VCSCSATGRSLITYIHAHAKVTIQPLHSSAALGSSLSLQSLSTVRAGGRAPHRVYRERMSAPPFLLGFGCCWGFVADKRRKAVPASAYVSASSSGTFGFQTRSDFEPTHSTLSSLLPCTMQGRIHSSACAEKRGEGTMSTVPPKARARAQALEQSGLSTPMCSRLKHAGCHRHGGSAVLQF
jgi:hypothetical protein